jgi:alpha-amylase
MNSKMRPTKKQYLNIYFQVHQPRRLRRFQIFDVGSDVHYFDDDLNKEILCRIANECYLPANQMLLALIKKFPGLRITFSISGSALEQLQEYAPVVIDSFRKLANTGAVEFLAETYYHSLAYFIDQDEFIDQVNLHRQKVYDLIGVWPVVFRNTELIYSNDIGKAVADLGFKAVLIDGVERALCGRTPNSLYRHPEADLILFPRNYQLSDDVAFRYSDKNWSEWPLTGNKFAEWLSKTPAHQKFVGLGMDYETFGEHKKADSGIFEFFEQFIKEVVREKQFEFVTPSEAIELIPAQQIISSAKVISWADEARNLSAWLGNNMQRDAFGSLYKFHQAIVNSGNPELIDNYRQLQTSDHFYYMSTKKDQDGNVHQYFSPYGSPYEAFMNYMNVMADLELKVKRECSTDIAGQKLLKETSLLPARH